MEPTHSAVPSPPLSNSPPPSPIDMSLFLSSKPPSPFDDVSVQSPPTSSSNLDSLQLRRAHSDPPSPLPLDQFMDCFTRQTSPTGLSVTIPFRQVSSDPPSPLPLDQFMDHPTEEAMSPTAPSVSAEIPQKHSDPPSPLPLDEFMDGSALLGITSKYMKSEKRSDNGTPSPTDDADHLAQHPRSVVGDRIVLSSYRRLFDVDGTRWSSLQAAKEPGVRGSHNVLNLYATEIWFKRYHHFWKNPILNWSFVDMPHASLALFKCRSVKPEDISFEKLTAVLLQRETITVRYQL